MSAPFDEGTRPFKVFLDAGLKPIPGKTPDERLLDATMKDLLEHRVGWNPPRAMDVMKELELDRMPREMDFLRWLASSPLTHGPKDPEKYSNEAFSSVATNH